METITKNEVKKITWPEKTFIIKRATVAFDKLQAFFADCYGEMYGTIQRMGIEVNDPPCAIYYSINEATMETDLAAAVPVPTNRPAITEFEDVTIPKSDAIMSTHYGSYDSMGTSYEIMEKYLVDHKLKRDLIVEEYFSDPEIEKDPAKWKTNIYFILKKEN